MCRSAQLRPAPEPDVRHDRAGLPGEPDARVHLHDGRRGSNVTYNHIGVSDAFHPLSHHQNDKARKERLVKIQTYHSQAFAKFLTKLAAMPDGDGSVLDHSIMLSAAT